MTQQQQIMTGMDPFAVLGAPWYATAIPPGAVSAQQLLGFSMPPPTTLHQPQLMVPAGVMHWPMADPSGYSAHPADVAAAQNALLGKRKLPAFSGYPGMPGNGMMPGNPSGHEHMVMTSNPSFAFVAHDPLKRKRQY